MKAETYYSARKIMEAIHDAEVALARVPEDPKFQGEDTRVSTSRGEVKLLAGEAREVYAAMRAALQRRLKGLEQELEDL